MNCLGKYESEVLRLGGTQGQVSMLGRESVFWEGEGGQRYQKAAMEAHVHFHLENNGGLYSGP